MVALLTMLAPSAPLGSTVTAKATVVVAAGARRPPAVLVAPVPNLAELSGRIAHIVQACFGGRRLVVFSGGESGATQAMIDMAKGIHAGGGNGSIIGRNTFQRPKAEALALLESITGVYKG